MLNFFKKAKKAERNLSASEKSNSRPQFHNLKVLEITRETGDCVSVSFDVPEELSADYRFIPGQYLTLETEIDGEAVRRS